MTSSAASRYDKVKLTTDSYQFRVAHLKLQVVFQLHLPSARNLQNYGDAFSNSGSIYHSLC